MHMERVREVVVATFHNNIHLQQRGGHNTRTHTHTHTHTHMHTHAAAAAAGGKRAHRVPARLLVVLHAHAAA